MGKNSKASSHRPRQVAESIRQILGAALVEDSRDPRLARVTITEVTASPDLSHAVVRFVTSDEAGSLDRAIEGFESARGFLRGRLAKSLGTRVVPELRFEADLGAVHAGRIADILSELHRTGELD